jgi:hypothetical protein
MNKINILDQLIYFQKNIRDEEDAYNLYKGLYSTCLINLLESKNFKEFFNLENLGLEKLVKIFDNQNHFNKCLKIFDDILHDAFKKKIFKSVTPKKYNNKIAFYIINLGKILAHVEVFINFLENIDQDKFSKYQVDIFTPTPSENVHEKIKNLCKVLNINIFSFNKTDLYASYQSIIRFYIDNGYKNLIFLSTVHGISFISKSLPDNVSWFALKHLSDSFKSLKQIYTPQKDADLYLKQNKNVFVTNFKSQIKQKLINCNFKYKNINFYTINRVEKIRDGIFLNVIKEILEKFPNSTFSWTGRQKDRFIEDFFYTHNLSQRVFFLGWIDIDKTGLKHGDIFLDTEKLSGIVAIKSFASGIPTVFFNKGLFWLNHFKDEIVKNKELYNYSEQEVINDWFNDLNNHRNSYLNVVTKLSANEKYFKDYVNLSIKLSRKYFDSEIGKKGASLLFDKMIC